MSLLSNIVAAVKKSRDGAAELRDREKVAVMAVIIKLGPRGLIVCIGQWKQSAELFKKVHGR